ncbi:hypothetical protein O6H91_05G004600 [Diphasiastrum complanatum]|uniref:Uncharacterized protein n=1 Tax=Diphasiastrum complanatum TaxID=34168 RepID=A0ACC2DL25_DIPCM|nr:hypothetical protein O6H91_05G004600 [Diphasiastrum complanatum]
MGKEPMTDVNGRPFKSFLDIIQGKEGRFRENLLGKRVDYSFYNTLIKDNFTYICQKNLLLHTAREPSRIIKTLPHGQQATTMATPGLSLYSCD